MLVTREMVRALVAKGYRYGRRPPEWANPVIQINAREWILTTALLTCAEEGRLIRHLSYAALAGDVVEVLSWPFVDGIKRGAVGNHRPGLPLTMRKAVLERDGARCRQCGAADELEIDHIKPWVLGGRHTPNNLQVLCGTCNRKKGPRPYASRASA